AHCAEPVPLKRRDISASLARPAEIVAPMSLPPVKTRERLSEVRYEIRGELARRARELEAQGRRQIKLNIGNPGAFGFRAPEHLQRAIAERIEQTDPYTHQQGLPAAREAIAAFHRQRGTPNASPERVFVGNGVSELIDLSLRALLNPGDEVLLPSPDYPLWSAATILNDGRPVYYQCKPENGFLPSPEEIESLVSPRTRAIVLINPNNPTGAAYPRELLEKIVAVAQRHKLLLMSDEIYDSILYDEATLLRWHRWPATCRACRSVACPRCIAPVAGAWAGPCSAAIRSPAATCTTRWTCSARCACAPTCRGSSRSKPRCTAKTPSRRCARRAGACTKHAAR